MEVVFTYASRLAAVNRLTGNKKAASGVFWKSLPPVEKWWFRLEEDKLFLKKWWNLLTCTVKHGGQGLKKGICRSRNLFDSWVKYQTFNHDMKNYMEDGLPGLVSS